LTGPSLEDPPDYRIRIWDRFGQAGEYRRGHVDLVGSRQRVPRSRWSYWTTETCSSRRVARRYQPDSSVRDPLRFCL